MSKKVLVLLAILATSPMLFAEDVMFTYTCENIKSTVFNDTLLVKIFKNNEVVVSIEDLPYVGRGNATPKTIKGKNFMIAYIVKDPGSAEYQLDIEPLLMEEALFNGGYKLKTGGLGGFVKFVGQGFSYENFLCRH
jgi:hypothetical protein